MNDCYDKERKMAKTKAEILAKIPTERLEAILRTTVPVSLLYDTDMPGVTGFVDATGDDIRAELARRAPKVPDIKYKLVSAPPAARADSKAEVKVGQRWREKMSNYVRPVVSIRNGTVHSGFWSWSIPDFVASHTLVEDAPAPEPRVPKAGEVWRDRATGRLVLIDQEGHAIHCDDRAVRTFVPLHETNGKPGFCVADFYASSFDEAAKRRAAELGASDPGDKMWWELNDILLGAGFRVGSTTVVDAIRSLVAAKGDQPDYRTELDRVFDGCRRLGMAWEVRKTSDDILAFVGGIAHARDAAVVKADLSERIRKSEGHFGVWQACISAGMNPNRSEHRPVAAFIGELAAERDSLRHDVDLHRQTTKDYAAEIDSLRSRLAEAENRLRAVKVAAGNTH